MFFSGKIRLSASALVAHRATIQTLEVLMGQEVVLCDLELKLGKISSAEGIGYREIQATGYARCVDETGRISAPFYFALTGIPLMEIGQWSLQGSKSTQLTVDLGVVEEDGVKHYAVHWTFLDNRPFQSNLPQAHIAQEIPKPVPPTMWIIGRNHADRREEPVLSV